MVCDQCGKETATYKTIKQNETLQYVCPTCFHHSNLETNFPIDSYFDEYNHNKTIQTSVDTCNMCGTTLEDFKKTGLLGCEECYAQFVKQLLPIIEKMQGSTHYMGKHLSTHHKAIQQQKLEDQIKICVQNEDYLKAAQLKKELDRLRGEE